MPLEASWQEKTPLNAPFKRLQETNLNPDAESEKCLIQTTVHASVSLEVSARYCRSHLHGVLYLQA